MLIKKVGINQAINLKVFKNPPWQALQLYYDPFREAILISNLWEGNFLILRIFELICAQVDNFGQRIF